MELREDEKLVSVLGDPARPHSLDELWDCEVRVKHAPPGWHAGRQVGRQATTSWCVQAQRPWKSRVSTMLLALLLTDCYACCFRFPLPGLPPPTHPSLPAAAWRSAWQAASWVWRS